MLRARRSTVYLALGWALVIVLVLIYSQHKPAPTPSPPLSPAPRGIPPQADCSRVRQETQNQIVILKDENALLKQQIEELRAEKGQRQARSEKFLMYFPTDGPNNQLYGFKELLTYAKILNRRVVLPTFFHHRRVGKNSTFPFEYTYEPQPFIEEFDAVSMKEFAKECKDQLHIVYTRRAHPHWDAREKLYREENDLGEALTRIYPDYVNGKWSNRQTDPIWYSPQEIANYFEEYSNVKCLGIGFPYHNSQGDEMDRRTKMNSRFFTHAKHIRDTADAVLKELGLESETYLAIHWRESEEGCQLERDEVHEPYDMCFGTSGFNWAKSDDVIEGALEEMRIHDLKGVYMATDSMEDQVVAKFRARLPNFHRGNVDSKILTDMEENYYRSLVEQEIMMRGKYFLGSYYSSWSVAVWMWWEAKPKHTDRSVWLENLLRKYGKPMVLHNNGDTPPYGHIKVTYQEVGELRTWFETRTAACSDSRQVPYDNYEYTLCARHFHDNPKCVVVSATLQRTPDLKLEQELAEGGCTVYVLAPSLKGKSYKGIEILDMKLDLATYENTRTLHDFLNEKKINVLDLLIMDINGKEFRVMKTAAKDGTLRTRVRQVISRANVYPVFKNGEEHWPKTLAARSLLFLDVLRAMQKEGMEIFASSDDSKVETVKILSWLNSDLMSNDDV